YAILRLDDNGNVESWNYGAQRIYGYSSNEIIGRHYSNFFSHVDIAEKLPAQLLEKARHNVWADNQGLRRRKDGILFPVESSITALYSTTNGLSGFSVVTRDITERKKVEEDLAASEALLNQSQLLAAVGSWRMYPQTGEIIWSAETYHMFGIPKDTTITYDKFIAIVHPDDRDEVNRAWHNSAQGIPYKIQHRIIVNDEIRWVDEDAILEFDDEGNMLIASGAVKDITDRKKFEHEQQQLRRAMRLLSDCNLSLVHASTEQQLLDDVCRLVVNTGGYMMVWIGFPDDDEDKQVRVMANFGVHTSYLKNAHISWDGEKETGRGPTGTAIRTGKTQINEDVLTNPVMELWRESAIKNGYRSSIALPLNCHQQTLGCLTIYAKDPMAFSADEVKLLEEMALNIAFGIESFKSDKKRIEAEQATVAKSNFLANMSHEIRTPLNAITGMAQLVRRSGVTAEQDEQLERIDKAGEHLLEIINAVLDLSKIEAGKFKLEETHINISDIVKSVADILFERVSAKNLTLSIEPFTGPLTLLGDATRLKQALLNYAGNALKFTDTGSITIRTLVDNETENTIVVRFEVEDTGVGISDEVVERLFHSFEQADNTLTRKHGGTGLGLAITRKIAELMGGDAGVKSVPGVGSIFWFTARLNKIQNTSAEIKKPNTKIATENLGTAEQVLQRDFPSLRILLADDEPNNRMLVENILETINPVIDLAVNGLEAFQKAEKNQYDIILMDMQMPEMNGLDATRKIRALSGREDIPIIAMTGNAFSEDVTNCLDAGMNDFIAKPFRMNMLFETILKWLVQTDK
ncbi:MAG: response regulator, partial [Gammaproteobacteria bacterium]|nr:response regulator [Gammaproteobacteria bacterium]